MTDRAPQDLESVLDRVRTALAIRAGDLRLEWGNEAFFREFPEARLGVPLGETPGPWNRSEVERLLRQTGRSGLEFDQLEVDGPERAGRGTKLLLTACPLPIRPQDGRILLAIEKPDARCPRRDARAPYLALQDMAAEIAHEFSNLLVDVLGNAAAAEDELDPESKATRSVQRVQSTARRAVELANRLLLFSGRTNRRMETLDLRQVIDEETTRLGRSLPAHIALEVGLESDPVHGVGDDALLRQVLAAILENAVEGLADRRGSIRVRAGPVWTDPSWLDRSRADHGLPAGEYASIDIEDTGPGMDGETLERACEPFFSTRFGECGLGLAAATGAVRAMGGALAISSDPGRGTHVQILLPREGPALAPSPHSSPDPPLALDATVLLVEHDPQVLELARSSLVGLGVGVVAAQSPDEATAIFRARPDRFRSVVLDCSAPDHSAERALRELLRVRPDVAIVLSTHRGAREDRSLALGRHPLLEKPYTPGELIDRLSEAVARTTARPSSRM
ncbi:MAG: ATP-binding protein [Myxococcota bacterium]